MADAIYHLGHGPDSIIAPNGVWESVVSAAKSDYSRSYLDSYNAANSFIALKLGAKVEDGTAAGWWLHFKWHVGAFLGTTSIVSFLYGGVSGFSSYSASLEIVSDVLYLRLYGYGSASHTDSTSLTLTTGSLVDLDFHCYTSGGNSYFDLYEDGTLIKSVSRTTDSNNGIEAVTFGRAASHTWSTRYSEFMVANFDTRGVQVRELCPTGAGDHSEQASGTYQSIDESAGLDMSYLVFDTLNQRMTFTHDGLPVGTITGVALNAVASGDETNYLNGLVRVFSVDYVQAALAQDSAMVPRRVIMMTDPSTGVAWSGSLGSHQFGFKYSAT